jgi:2-polyprenyl-3-methyl-5-hydroxy-6-metoxy-1,4-benzoquinol methylase
MSLGSAAFLYLAWRATGISPTELAISVSRGLWLPVATCLVVAAGIAYLLRPNCWPMVIGISLAAGIAYLVTLYYAGAREEERTLMRTVLSLPVMTARFACSRLRRLLGRVGLVRSARQLVFVLRECLIENPDQAYAYFENLYESRPDPFAYNTNPWEGERLRRATEVLDAIRNGACFQEALEVGCSEGAFTELLAVRSKSLLAVDLSRVALGRARARCCWRSHVRFDARDLQRDPLGGPFDVVVAMSVLECLSRPWAIRAACAKLVDVTRSGGYLLVGNMRHRELYEDSLWAKYFMRGGKHIDDFIRKRAALKVVSTATDDSYVLTLFQKVM